MMQSILLTPDKAPQAVDKTKSVDDPLASLEGEEGNTEDIKKQFSELLSKASEALDGAEQGDSFLADVNEEVEMSAISPDGTVNSTEKESEDGEEVKEVLDEDETRLLLETENLLIDGKQQVNTQSMEKGIVDNSLLAKIEMAKQIDTRVTDLKENKLQNNSEKEALKSGEIKDGDVKASDLKLTETNQFSVTTKLETNIKQVEPIAINASLNSESDFANAKEIKLTNVNDISNVKQTELMTKMAQTNALQQPVELQSKQAAAMLSERILMMLNQSKQEVTIRLDPAELGSMHVKIQVHNDQVQLSIQAHVGQTKELLEQNLPRLKELLSEQGIDLSEANIEQQNQKNSQQQNASSDLSAIKDERELQHIENNEDIPVWLNAEMAGSDKKVDYYA